MRNLKECLTIQLENDVTTLAYKIITEYFDDFMNTKYSQKIIEQDLVLLTVLLPKLNKDKLYITYFCNENITNKTPT